jgi:hypothetical protein
MRRTAANEDAPEPKKREASFEPDVCVVDPPPRWTSWTLQSYPLAHPETPDVIVDAS